MGSKAGTRKAGRKPRITNPVVQAVMPLEHPTPLECEVWRLKRHRAHTFGQIARNLHRYLAPRSESSDPFAVRKTLAKRMCKRVDDFLQTPIGRVIQSSEAWQGWQTIAIDQVRLRLVPSKTLRGPGQLDRFLRARTVVSR